MKSQYLGIIVFLIIIIIVMLFIPRKSYEPFVENDSLIHGTGLFSEKDYEPDQQILHALYLDGSKWSVSDLASKINHCPASSDKLNSYLKKMDDGWYLFSKTNIASGQEITVDYNDSPHFIRKPNDDWTC